MSILSIVLTRSRTAALALCAIAALACDRDFLVTEPPDQINEQDFWTHPDDAISFVNAIYPSLPGIDGNYDQASWGMVFWDVFSDNGHAWSEWVDPVAVANGSFGPASPIVRWMWSRNYKGVRQANVLLANIDSVPDLDPDLRDRVVGEARFLRAFFYHDLVRFFGGVPLITEPQSLDATDVARASEEEVTAFILEELEQAVDLLPAQHGADDVGRATQGAALALRSRILLYDDRWSDAAAAARDVMDLGVHSLFDDYGGVFQPENEDNAEVIFAKQYVVDNFGSGMDGWNQPPGAGGWGTMNPLQSLVDAYESIDGRPIEESPLHDPANPFENRDPRLDATILHTGSTFRGQVLDTRPGASPNGINGGPNTGATGYYMRKHLDEGGIPTERYNSPTDWILLRYAEVLLNFAEAANESDGPAQPVYEAINEIRARGGMPPLLPGLSQAEMRERIRRERRIELAFEGHRYFDLRRWNLAGEMLDGPVFGIEVDGENIPVAERVWLPRHELWPIPQSEMDVNSELKQNPGW